MGEHATETSAPAEDPPTAEGSAAMTEHLRPIGTRAGDRRPGAVLQALDTLGDLAEVRELVAKTTDDVRRRARAGAERSVTRLAEVAPDAVSATKAAPVVSLANRATSAWKLASTARRNRRQIALGVAAATALVALLAIRRRRKRRDGG